jgi:WD40 repeat protein
MRIWSTWTRTGTPLTGHNGWVRAVALGRVGDRDVIVSGSDDRTVRIWDAATGRLMLVQDTVDDPVNAIAVDGDRLAIAAGNTVIAASLT